MKTVQNSKSKPKISHSCVPLKQLAIKMLIFTISGMDLEENNRESVSLRYFPSHCIYWHTTYEFSEMEPIYSSQGSVAEPSVDFLERRQYSSQARNCRLGIHPPSVD